MANVADYIANKSDAVDRSANGIIGVSPWARGIRERIHQIAGHQSTVLIVGPSGTGKEFIARAIHAASPRAAKPFIPVNCAAVTGTLFTSHMFGHVRGAFTGADYPAVGCFRAADGGTILMDEIGELDLELQAMLLRVLQERAVVFGEGNVIGPESLSTLVPQSVSDGYGPEAVSSRGTCSRMAAARPLRY